MTAHFDRALMLFRQRRFDQAEKDKLATEDERDEGKKEVDELTKKYTTQADELLKAKTDEIMEV